jgi:N4-gp56 family major capsid protein
MKAVSLTDEAALSGFGDPVGETNAQLLKSIAGKIDTDAMDALQGAQLKYDGSATKISYAGIVDAIDAFGEEFNSEKVILVHPAQVSALRKDTEFTAADSINEKLLVKGAIGKICNCEVVVSRRVPLNEGGTAYVCPIVKLNEDGETEDESPAVTIYVKRDVNVETERDTLSRTTTISVDEIYATALTNASKVVLASFKK